MSNQGTFQPEILPEATPQPTREADPLALIEKRNALFERLLSIAITATHAGHWFDQNGKPYLGAAGAEAVARRCAVSVKETKRTKEVSSDDKGEFYFYVVSGKFSLPGGHDEVEAIGTCSSRDNFLGTETKAGRNLSEIDEGNVLKAAYSNMIVNGVTRLLGIRGMTWERLAELGIDQAKAQKVEYASGGKGGSASKEFTFPFGKSKGKAPSEVADSDLDWYLKAFRESLADPEKAKYKVNTEKQIAAVEVEIARRKNAAPVAGPSPWAQIQKMATDKGLATGVIGGIVKAATGRTSTAGLTQEDVAKVEAALAALPVDEPL